MGLYFLVVVFGFVVLLFLINGYYLKKDVSNETDRSKSKTDENSAERQKRGEE